MKTYSFAHYDTDVDVEIVGQYRAIPAKDIDVYVRIGGEEYHRLFEEIDNADEVMEWLIDKVEFESVRAFNFNRYYIQSVMIDKDMTEAELLDKAANWTDEYLAEIKCEFFATPQYSVYVHDAQNLAAAYQEVGTFDTYREALNAYDNVDLEKERDGKNGNDMAKELWLEYIDKDGEPVYAEPTVLKED